MTVRESWLFEMQNILRIFGDAQEDLEALPEADNVASQVAKGIDRLRLLRSEMRGELVREDVRYSESSVFCWPPTGRVFLPRETERC